MSGDAAIAEVVQALRDEDAAREKLRDARERLAAALDALREERVPDTTIAHRIAKALGLPLTVRERRRVADLLRQRRARARHRTDRHVDRGAMPAVLPDAAVGSAARAIEPGKETETMSKLIRKTTTVVEYLRAPQAEDDDIDREEGDLGEPEDEDDEDEAPRRRRASRRDG